MNSPDPTRNSLEDSDVQESAQRVYSSEVFLKHGRPLMGKTRAACVHCPSAMWMFHGVKGQLRAYCRQMHKMSYDENEENDPITTCDGREVAIAELREKLEEQAEQELAEQEE